MYGVMIADERLDLRPGPVGGSSRSAPTCHKWFCLDLARLSRRGDGSQIQKANDLIGFAKLQRTFSLRVVGGSTGTPEPPKAERMRLHQDVLRRSAHSDHLLDCRYARMLRDCRSDGNDQRRAQCLLTFGREP